MAEETRTTGAQQDEAKGVRPTAVVWMVLHLLPVIGAMALLIPPTRLNPHAHVPKHPTTEQARTCTELRARDDLVHLALRRPAAARAQVARWTGCDPTVQHRALDAIRWDWLLIGCIAFALAIGTSYSFWSRFRWRPGAVVCGALAALYVVSDIAENVLLRDLLEGNQASEWLHRWASIKFGALAGALPIFLLSFALVIGDFTRKHSVRSELKGREKKIGKLRLRDRCGRAASRWARRLLGRGSESTPPATDAPLVRGGVGEQRRTEDSPTLGVCCSGGGIRSAAFNLGALQALETPAVGGHDPSETELARVQWLSAVSGGSYIAAAWVTARDEHARVPDPRRSKVPWSRESAEEDHLRRHASYLAPGVTGKLWALCRFLFGFMLNVGLVTIATGALLLPYGWLVDHFDEADLIGAAGTIVVPNGGCLQEASGRTLVVLPGNSLKLADGDRVRLNPKAPPIEPSAKSAAGSIKINLGDTSAEGSVSGAGSTEASVNLPGTGTASGRVEVGSGSTTTTTAPPTQAPECPAPPSIAPSNPNDVRAAAPGRRLSSGTKVLLQITGPIPISPSEVSACITSTGCGQAQTEFMTTSRGTFLVSAENAMLDLDHSAIVTDQGGLAKACGAEQCEGYRLPRPFRLVAVALGGLALYAGLGLVMASTSPRTSKWVEHLARPLASLAAIFALVAYILPWLVVWAENGRSWLREHALVASAGGLGAVLLAVIAQIAPFLGAAEASSDTAGRAVAAVKAVGRRLRPLLVRLAGAVIGPLVVFTIGLAFASSAARSGPTATQFALWLALLGPFFVVVSGADLNEWSIHPFYRDRLRSAFAVDPVKRPPEDPREDPLDNLRDGAPRLLVCAAANLNDSSVTAPGRPVASWVFSRDEVGSSALDPDPALDGGSTGFVRPEVMGQFNGYYSWTWTAVAVSGAAIAPAMGKMNRPERFLLALANLRLGVWLPNPRYLNDPVERLWYLKHHPRPAYLAKEALGIHKPADRWIYVTDGGHYENLGLVELLRRNCTEIICFDASGDSPDTFGTLADAMRLAREEMGIEIVLDPTPMKPDPTGVSAIGVWAGVIHYPDREPGWLVIAKLAVPKTAPFDIIDLARTLRSFPNHPTSDQLYTDQKFEAYRALGFHLGQEATKLAIDIRSFLEQERDVEQAVRLALKPRRPASPTKNRNEGVEASA